MRPRKYVQPWYMRVPPEGLWDFVEREGRLPWSPDASARRMAAVVRHERDAEERWTGE